MKFLLKDKEKILVSISPDQMYYNSLWMQVAHSSLGDS